MIDECGIYGIVHTIDTLSGVVESGGNIHGKVESGGVLIGSVGFPKCAYPPIYAGDYVFTPSADTQTIEIAKKTARTDITINPIPSNYGLVSWDGATLTVS